MSFFSIEMSFFLPIAEHCAENGKKVAEKLTNFGRRWLMNN
jgi:hypothetical protein